MNSHFPRVSLAFNTLCGARIIALCSRCIMLSIALICHAAIRLTYVCIDSPVNRVCTESSRGFSARGILRLRERIMRAVALYGWKRSVLGVVTPWKNTIARSWWEKRRMWEKWDDRVKKQDGFETIEKLISEKRNWAYTNGKMKEFLCNFLINAKSGKNSNNLWITLFKIQIFQV